METFLRNRTFEIEFEVINKDDLSAVNLSLLTELTIVIRKINGGKILVTKKLSDIDLTNPASGLCSIYINQLDTLNAEPGVYEYYVSPEKVDTNYTNNLSVTAGWDKCFILQ